VKKGTACGAPVSAAARPSRGTASLVTVGIVVLMTRERAARLRKTKKTKLAVVGIAIVLLIGLLSWPIKIVCPMGPCSTAPDADGYVHRNYEIQPLGAPLIQMVMGKNFDVSYSSGVEKDRDNS
jgi:hypothetical protein